MARLIMTLITVCSLILSAMNPVPGMRYEYVGQHVESDARGAEESDTYGIADAIPEEPADIKAEAAPGKPMDNIAEAVPEEPADIKAEAAPGKPMDNIAEAVPEEPSDIQTETTPEKPADSGEGQVSDNSADSDDVSSPNNAVDETGSSVSDNSAEEKEDTDSEEAVTDENGIVTTKHTVTISGNEISYTAKAGMMELESDGVKCKMFYTAYTVDDEEDRPVTFAFNGGPGASSFYLHIGCLGPRTVKLNYMGEPATLPTELTDNDNSILDITDLVFIDPVGTGFSYPENEEDLDHFIGYDNDVRTVGDFIRQYTDQNNRWGDEKYIAGESYGTTRAVGVCDYLADTYAMYLNGLMLISGANDYSVNMPEQGNDDPYVVSLPTYAADAWYHGKLSGDYQDMELEAYLEEVKAFAADEYLIALFKGSRLTESEKDSVAEKISGYTGLSKDYVLDMNLRIDFEDFCRELLKDKGRTVGRYDGRMTGPSVSGSVLNGSADPSSHTADIAYTDTFLEYVTEELKFKTDREFIPLNYDVFYAWDFLDDGYMGYISQEEMIYNIMSNNKFLKIWVIGGYYDGATPFYSVEWIFDHIFLSDDRKSDLSLSFYPSGHLFYLDKESRGRFREEALKWYK